MRFLRASVNVLALLSLPVWGGFLFLCVMLWPLIADEKGTWDRRQITGYLRGRKWIFETVNSEDL